VEWIRRDIHHHAEEIQVMRDLAVHPFHPLEGYGTHGMYKKSPVGSFVPFVDVGGLEVLLPWLVLGGVLRHPTRAEYQSREVYPDTSSNLNQGIEPERCRSIFEEWATTVTLTKIYKS
jgi:hypothetical protein